MKSLVVLAVLSSTIAAASPSIDATLDDNRDLRVRVRGPLVLDPWDAIDGAAPAHTDYVLRVDGTKWIPPAKLTTFAESENRVAIAFVMFGGEIWIGNDEVEREPNATHLGVLKELSPAFDRVMRKLAAPAGSTITILTYADRVTVRVPETPLDALPELALGIQRDYRGRIGNELVAGVERGLAELENSTAPIKALIVVTDGVDAKPDVAPRMRVLAERGIARGIRMHAILYGSSLHRDPAKNDDIPDTLEPTQFVALYPFDIETRLRTIFQLTSQNVELTFPARELVFDGRIHDLQLELGVLKMPFRYQMPDLRPRPPVAHRTEDSRTWTPFVIGGAALVVLALGIAMLRRRATPS